MFLNFENKLKIGNGYAVPSRYCTQEFVMGVDVSVFNFIFLQYSVDKETKNSLNTCYKFNSN